MGSPYNVCEISLSGEWLPELPVDDWQNVKARSPGGGRLALVRWNAAGNEPGFHIYVIDESRRAVDVSPRFRGCCESIRWLDESRIAWSAFPEEQGVYCIEA